MNFVYPAIVIPAYNRPSALLNLLNSLSRANYPSKVRLIISLEANSNAEVVNIAKTFSDKKFEVEVVVNLTKLGLKKHVLKCGDLSLTHGSIILLEDDLLVDPHFYGYAIEALQFYQKDTHVAGVALYSNQFNEYYEIPFKPMNNGFSAYHMQIPCSWGQCWTSTQWKEFKKWYESKTESDISLNDELPDKVKSWPATSWKKYFAAYLVDEKKFFIYPYEAYSTNCSQEGGAHILNSSNVHQVFLSIPDREKPCLKFPVTSAASVAYDSCMEPIGLFVSKAVSIDMEDLVVDLYGKKSFKQISKKKYCLTSKNCSGYISTFPRCFKPIEYNLIFKNYTDSPSFYWLVESNLLESAKNSEITMADYSYYTNIELLSKRVFIQLFKELSCRAKLILGKKITQLSHTIRDICSRVIGA